MSAEDKDKIDLLEQLDQLMKLGKEYRGPGEGFKASVKLGEYAASFEITPQPVIASGGRSGGRPRPQPKAISLDDLGKGLMEYQDKIAIEEATLQNGTNVLRITPKTFLGDQWEGVRDAIGKVVGGSPRWVPKGDSPTGKGHWWVPKA